MVALSTWLFSNVVAYFLLLITCTHIVHSQSFYRWVCDRMPEETTKEPQIGDGGYEIKIKLLNNSQLMVYRYELGQSYRIIIANRFPGVTFTNFYLTAVPQHVPVRGEYLNGVGEFEHFAKPAQTESVESCPGLVTGIVAPASSNINTITHFRDIEVQWTAPLYKNADCIEFRATVEYSPNEYFKDQGMLTKILCPTFENVVPKTNKPALERRGQSLVSDGAFSTKSRTSEYADTEVEYDMSMKRRHIKECCACGHAVYRMEVKGFWTRYQHPKNFPAKEHDAHWTSIIGATHSEAYNIYYIGGKAKEAVKSVCTIGDTTSLEKEFKEKGKWNILNVIKTSGLWGESSLTDKRTALFSVNRTHHLLSFLSMLGPSPDWCAGVDDLDPCDTGCTWKKNMTVPLYAWDAGVKTGKTYVTKSSDKEDDVVKYLGKGIIYKEGPFEIGKNGKAKPVAELVITRTRPTQDWVCENNGLQQNDANQPNTVPSTRKNSRKEPLWRQEKKNEGSMIDTYPEMIQKKMRMKCLVSPWVSWSQCSITCGSSGVRRRTRRLETNLMEGECEKLYHLNETETCTPAIRNCEYKDCDTTTWSEWSFCVAECNGNGEQERFRSLYTPEKCPMNRQKEIKTREMRGCYRACNPKQICIKAYSEGAICTGGEDTFYYYNIESRTCLPFKYKGCKGNSNRFKTEKKCLDFCKRGLSDVSERDEQTMAEIQKTDLMVANGMTEPCKQASDSGYMCDNMRNTAMRTSQVGWYFDYEHKKCMHFSYNGCGGNDNRFKSKMECMRRCSHLLPAMGEARNCVMSGWGPWGPCSASCSGMRERARRILREPENGGSACPSLIDKSDCPSCCLYTQWNHWSPCSQTCNFMNLPSIKERRRQRLTPEKEQCTAQRTVERMECREYRNVKC